MSYEENKLMNLKDGRLLLKTLDERMKTEGFAPVMTNPYPDTIKTIENCAENMGMGFEIPIAPVQDLHGFANPWVGGAGKNLSPITVESIKSASSDLTWNGNSATSNDITFTILTDSDGNVTGINVNGTATGTAVLTMYNKATCPFAEGSYKINGLWANGSGSTFKHDLIYLPTPTSSNTTLAVDLTAVTGSDVVITQAVTEGINFKERLVIYSGQALTNVKLYPMVRLATNTDTTFEPYQNICPISGFTGVDISVAPTADPDDPDKTVYQITFPSEAGTVYGGTVTINEDGSGTLIVDRGYSVWDGSSNVSKGSGSKNYYLPIENGSIAGRTSSGWMTQNELSEIHLMCNLAKIEVSFDDTFAHASAYCGSAMVLQPRIFLPDCETAEDAKSWLQEQNADGHPLTWCYLLKEPITVNLTAEQVCSMLGTNTVWNSIGAFKCSYHLDPKIYVDDTAGIAGSIEKSDSTEEAVKTLTDGADNLPMEVTVAINPVQDLHGYDSPWPGGGGKNKLPLPVAETKNGITLVHNSDGSVTLTGTATSTTYFDFFAGTFDSTAFAGYKFIAYTTSGAIGSSALRFRISNSDRISIQEITSADTEITINDNGAGLYFGIRIPNGFAIPSGGYNIKPMLYASTESSVFAPYENSCHISGWDSANITGAGKNLFDSEMEIGQIKSDTGQNATATSKIRSKNYIPVKLNVIYTMSRSDTTGYVNFRLYDAEKNYLGTSDVNYFTLISGYSKGQPMHGGDSSCTFKFTENVAFLRFQDNITDLTAKYQLEIGSTASAYEPFGETHPIHFPQTVYGGTLTVNKDGSGRLVAYVEPLIITGDMVEAYGTGSNIANRVHTKLTYNQRYKANIVCCNNYPVLTDPAPVGSIGVRFHPTNGYIYIYNDSFADLADAQAKINANPVVCALELATPVIIDFTASQIRSLLGENNLWADSGNVLNVAYYADAKIYIDDQKELPVVTSSDNGKVLRVVDGVWSAVSLPSASGVSF